MQLCQVSEAGLGPKRELPQPTSVAKAFSSSRQGAPRLVWSRRSSFRLPKRCSRKELQSHRCFMIENHRVNSEKPEVLKLVMGNAYTLPRSANRSGLEEASGANCGRPPHPTATINSPPHREEAGAGRSCACPQWTATGWSLSRSSWQPWVSRMVMSWPGPLALPGAIAAFRTLIVACQELQVLSWTEAQGL